jgi:CpeT/CpcT family (DUF1001)
MLKKAPLQQSPFPAMSAAMAAAMAMLALATLTLAGCAAHKANARDEKVLDELRTRLPGRYDNAAQAHADLRLGVNGPHESLNLLIAPANASLIGKIAYYVRESAGDDPNRVFSQRIWVLGHALDLHTKEPLVEQRIYLFKEPQRWVHVGENPELLQSLVPEDLQQLPGCELIWKKRESIFEAHRKSEDCSPAAKYEGLLLEQRIELRENQLALAAQQVGPEGLLPLSSAQEDPFYRFVRRGSAN